MWRYLVSISLSIIANKREGIACLDLCEEKERRRERMRALDKLREKISKTAEQDERIDPL